MYMYSKGQRAELNSVISGQRVWPGICNPSASCGYPTQNIIVHAWWSKTTNLSFSTGHNMWLDPFHATVLSTGPVHSLWWLSVTHWLSQQTVRQQELSLLLQPKQCQVMRGSLKICHVFTYFINWLLALLVTWRAVVVRATIVPL